MQLKKLRTQMRMDVKKIKTYSNVGQMLSVATSTLLGGSVMADTNQFLEQGEWAFEAAVLLYSESGGRVNALEPVIKARRGLVNEGQLDFKLVIDSLTGASPTGAVPSRQIQTFTRPSGNDSYRVGAGEVPLDDTFHDTRVALSANWQKRLDGLSALSLGANLSSEYDFQSMGFSANYSQDFNQRNTTLLAGIAVEIDSINPVGRVPLPMTSAMVPVGQPQNRGDVLEHRDLIDLLFGWTQVMGRQTLMQFNISFSQSSGYHNDPYKFVSVVDDTMGSNFGEPIDHLYELRPDSRSKTAFFWRTLYSFERDVIDVSYRFLSDDWGIASSTIDLHYKWMQASGAYWEPHLRVYQQSAADFYRTLLPVSASIPTEMSADYRLGGMKSMTLGIKYSMPIQADHRIEYRLEILTQTNDTSSGSKIGTQADQKQILDTEALIFQIYYSF